MLSLVGKYSKSRLIAYKNYDEVWKYEAYNPLLNNRPEIDVSKVCEFKLLMMKKYIFYAKWNY